MRIIIGFLIVISSVLGGYVLSHGVLLALWQPFELIIIGGAALGAFIIANPLPVIHQTGIRIKRLFSNDYQYHQECYLDTLALIFMLLDKMRKEGMISLEADIELPTQSKIFSSYPDILARTEIIEFMTDYLRMMVTGTLDAFQLDNLMDIELDTRRTEIEQPAVALGKTADSLPGFGIVAAVMGVVITMGALGGPAEEIGQHVAAALVGTFLGILLAYGFVAPISIAMEHQAAEETNYFLCIKTCLMAALNGYPPPIAVEFGRKSIISEVRPTFQSLEEMLRSKKSAVSKS